MRKVQDNLIYLDAASTTPIFDEIIEDVYELHKNYFGNADSLHTMGQRVSSLVSSSRKQIAKYLNVLPHEVIFTSGGTESNVTAIKGIVFADLSKKHIITSNIEHSSVSDTLDQLERVFGYEVDRLSVNDEGVVDPELLKKHLRDDTILVAMMAINNEVGSIFPISDYARIIKKHSQAHFHVDGVQAFIKEPFSLKQVDTISFSAHKIGGLKGSGILIKKSNVPFEPLIPGGQQEFGYRGGTLNAISAIVFAKTMRLAQVSRDKNYEKIKELNTMLWEAFENDPDIVINSLREGTPYIFNMSVKNIGSEIMMNALNEQGIMVSARSTCHSQSNSPSPVLKALGRSDSEALSSIRISLADETTIEDIKQCIKVVMETKAYVQL